MPAKSIPTSPDLAQYKKQAKELVKAHSAREPGALSRVREQHPRFNAEGARLRVSDAQHVIAREHGFESWPKFARHIEALLSERSPSVVWRLAEVAVVGMDVETLERLLRDHGQLLRNEEPESSWLGNLKPDYSAPDARAILVANHMFASWDALAAFKGAVVDERSPVAQFERAADAIVTGDEAALGRLLRGNPALVRARSPRTHRSTLLHYVGSNGVESWRQRTPKNIVSLTKLLLAAGADANARADMYGGATVLGLAATSVHPWRAGVLEPLLEALLDGGALLDKSDSSLVIGCLANGRPFGAELLARRGVHLDLEAAAGVGRLHVVKSFFAPNGSLVPPASAEQMRNGFTWACEFGQADVVSFLLDRGMDVAARLRHHGQTGLHWAACGGHVETVRVLLKRGAPVDAEDEEWKQTPLGWALFGWGSVSAEASAGDFYEVVRLLVAAGAAVQPQWLQHERVQADARMRMALA
jgi:hypothetical protein